MSAAAPSPLPDLNTLWTHHLARLRGGLEAARRLATGYQAPVATTPRQTVFAEGGTKLYHFEPQPGATDARRQPLLIVPSLINRWYILDLTAGNSLIEALVAAGHDLYCVDWGDPGPAERRWASTTTWPAGWSAWWPPP